MPSFLSKVFGRKKDEKGSPQSLGHASDPSLLGGKFEAVSPVSPNASTDFPREPNGKDKDKEEKTAFGLFKVKSRPNSPDSTRKKDDLPQLSLILPFSKEDPRARTLSVVFEANPASRILSDVTIGGTRLTPSEVHTLVRICSQAITAQGLETLGIMRPHWYSASPDIQRRLISLFIHSLSPENSLSAISSSPLSSSSVFESEINYTRSPHDVAAVLRWGLRHLQLEGDKFGSQESWYKTFSEAERSSEYPPKAYSEKFGPLVPTTHLDLLNVTLDLFFSLAAKTEENSTSASKLAKAFGLWLLVAQRVQDDDDWSKFYSRWEKAGRMLEHIFLSRIRDEALHTRLPTRLLELVKYYPYSKGATAEEDVLLRPRLSTRHHPALFVRLESEFITSDDKVKRHPLQFIKDAIDTDSITDGNEYSEIWEKIRKTGSTTASASEVLPDGYPGLGRLISDESIRYLTLIPGDHPLIKGWDTPVFSFIETPASAISPNGTSKHQALGTSSSHTKAQVKSTTTTTGLPSHIPSPLSSSSLGQEPDWAQFSTSGFGFSNQASPTGTNSVALASTLFGQDVEKTNPKPIRKTSKRNKVSLPGSPKKSLEIPRNTSTATATAAQNSNPNSNSTVQGQDQKTNLVSKVVPVSIIQIDEAFIDFWIDAITDPITSNWPSFAICKLRSDVVSDLDSKAQEVEEKEKEKEKEKEQEKRMVEYLIVEHVYVPQSQSKPKPQSQSQSRPQSQPGPRPKSQTDFRRSSDREREQIPDRSSAPSPKLSTRSDGSGIGRRIFGFFSSISGRPSSTYSTPGGHGSPGGAGSPIGSAGGAGGGGSATTSKTKKTKVSPFSRVNELGEIVEDDVKEVVKLRIPSPKPRKSVDVQAIRKSVDVQAVRKSVDIQEKGKGKEKEEKGEDEDEVKENVKEEVKEEVKPVVEGKVAEGDSNGIPVAAVTTVAAGAAVLGGAAIVDSDIATTDSEEKESAPESVTEEVVVSTTTPIVEETSRAIAIEEPVVAPEPIAVEPQTEAHISIPTEEPSSQSQPTEIDIPTPIAVPETLLVVRQEVEAEDVPVPEATVAVVEETSEVPVAVEVEVKQEQEQAPVIETSAPVGNGEVISAPETSPPEPESELFAEEQEQVIEVPPVPEAVEVDAEVEVPEPVVEQDRAVEVEVIVPPTVEEAVFEEKSIADVVEEASVEPEVVEEVVATAESLVEKETTATIAEPEVVEQTRVTTVEGQEEVSEEKSAVAAEKSSSPIVEAVPVLEETTIIEDVAPIPVPEETKITDDAVRVHVEETAAVELEEGIPTVEKPAVVEVDVTENVPVLDDVVVEATPAVKETVEETAPVVEGETEEASLAIEPIVEDVAEPEVEVAVKETTPVAESALEAGYEVERTVQVAPEVETTVEVAPEVETTVEVAPEVVQAIEKPAIETTVEGAAPEVEIPVEEAALEPKVAVEEAVSESVTEEAAPKSEIVIEGSAPALEQTIEKALPEAEGTEEVVPEVAAAAEETAPEVQANTEELTPIVESSIKEVVPGALTVEGQTNTADESIEEVASVVEVVEETNTPAVEGPFEEEEAAFEVNDTVLEGPEVAITVQEDSPVSPKVQTEGLPVTIGDETKSTVPTPVVEESEEIPVDASIQTAEELAEETTLAGEQPVVAPTLTEDQNQVGDEASHEAEALPAEGNAVEEIVVETVSIPVEVEFVQEVESTLVVETAEEVLVNEEPSVQAEVVAVQETSPPEEPVLEPIGFSDPNPSTDDAELVVPDVSPTIEVEHEAPTADEPAIPEPTVQVAIKEGTPEVEVPEGDGSFPGSAPEEMTVTGVHESSATDAVVTDIEAPEPLIMSAGVESQPSEVAPITIIPVEQAPATDSTTQEPSTTEQAESMIVISSTPRIQPLVVDDEDEISVTQPPVPIVEALSDSTLNLAEHEHVIVPLVEGNEGDKVIPPSVEEPQLLETMTQPSLTVTESGSTPGAQTVLDSVKHVAVGGPSTTLHSEVEVEKMESTNGVAEEKKESLNDEVPIATAAT